MGATKADEFSVKDNRIAAYAKALSHPARVAILKLLVEKKSMLLRFNRRRTAPVSKHRLTTS